MGGRSAHSPVGRAVQRGLRSSMGRAVEGAEPSRAEPIFFSSPPPPTPLPASLGARPPPREPHGWSVTHRGPGRAGQGPDGGGGRRRGGGNGRLAPSPPPLSEEGR